MVHYFGKSINRHLVIISCSICCLVGLAKTTWVCASFDCNLVIISCSICCLVGLVKTTWVCASFDCNLVIISCSTCCLVGPVKALTGPTRQQVLQLMMTKLIGNLELFWTKKVSGFYTKYYRYYSVW